MAQLSESLRLDLSDTLTGNVELLADFLKRALSAVVESEAQTEHLASSLGKGSEHVVELLFKKHLRCRLCRSGSFLVRYEVTEVAVLLLAYRRFEGNGVL